MRGYCLNCGRTVGISENGGCEECGYDVLGLDPYSDVPLEISDVGVLSGYDL